VELSACNDYKTVVWIKFIICSGFIVVTGASLSRYGDVIAEKSGIGKAWIGLVLMASITSLPELITGVSAVAMVGSLDIAYGSIMGSCVFNLFILALLDPMSGVKPIFQRAGKGHLLSALFGMVLIVIASLAVIISDFTPSFFQISIVTPVIVLIYGYSIKILYDYEKKVIVEFVDDVAEKIKYKDFTLKRALIMYGINATLVVVAASFLPFIADEISEVTGLGGTFVGSAFVALATSLPEVVISIAAVKIGALDMAVANMFGSNMFNILILGIDDIVYRGGTLYSGVATSHAVTGFMAILMTLVAVIALAYRADRHVFLRFGWASSVMIVIGIINFVVLFLMR
ncbi:MAG: sodium:calcium antiporter, partial [Thermodesulfobacteriota bacterium]